MKLVLASNSEPRAAILRKLAIECIIAPTNVAEDLDKALFADPRDYCDATCALKANSIVNNASEDVVYLTADTIVISEDGKVLEKPQSVAQAKAMLLSYSRVGTAKVYTCICMLKGKRMVKRGKTTVLRFRDFGEKEVDEYLRKHYLECSKGCGALAVLGSSARWIEEVSGCFYNAAGLSPSVLFELSDQLDNK